MAVTKRYECKTLQEEEMCNLVRQYMWLTRCKTWQVATDACCLNEDWETAENMHRSGLSFSFPPSFFPFLLIFVLSSFSLVYSPGRSSGCCTESRPNQLLFNTCYFYHFRSGVELIFAFVSRSSGTRSVSPCSEKATHCLNAIFCHAS